MSQPRPGLAGWPAASIFAVRGRCRRRDAATITPMSDPRFVHLRVHSEFSIADGIVRLDDLVKAAAADGQGALALTDLGNAFGLVRFYQEARGKGVKPIAGCDVWITNPDDRDKPSRLLLLVRDKRWLPEPLRAALEGVAHQPVSRPRRGRRAMARSRARPGPAGAVGRAAGRYRPRAGGRQRRGRAPPCAALGAACSRAASTSSCSATASPAARPTCRRPPSSRPSCSCRWSPRTRCSS